MAEFHNERDTKTLTRDVRNLNLALARVEEQNILLKDAVLGMANRLKALEEKMNQ